MTVKSYGTNHTLTSGSPGKYHENLLFAPHKQIMKLPGFSTLYYGNMPVKPGRLMNYAIKSESFEKGYAEFLTKVQQAIGHHHLPIYRMADGEFTFCTEHLAPVQPLGRKEKMTKIVRNAYFFLFGRNLYNRKIQFNQVELFQNLFNSRYFFVAHGEAYTSDELDLVKDEFIRNIREIANEGFLALHYVEMDGKLLYERTAQKMLTWFDSHSIKISHQNYAPFYYVYALLNGYQREIIYRDKNILIITHFSEEKKNRISDRLLNSEQAKNVDFINISPAKSMHDQIDLDHLIFNPDVILIAAGIGTLNIIKQVKHLNTLVIDAGINIEVMANPNLQGARFFLGTESGVQQMIEKKL